MAWPPANAGGARRSANAADHGPNDSRPRDARDAIVAEGRRHGRAEDADLDARPLRSRCARDVTERKLPQGGPSDIAGLDARGRVGTSRQWAGPDRSASRA